jgi:hypothetical protein
MVIDWDTLLHPWGTAGDRMNAKLADFAAAAIPHGLVMELGVAKGTSLRPLANWFAPRTVYGFDWFKGLPENWRDADGNLHKPAGAFACEPPTDLPSNAVLVRGLFEETLPAFCDAHDEPISFVHVDCDLYSSTKFVLKTLERYGLHDAVIVFDELCNSPAYDAHEGRAFREWLDESGYRVRFLGQHHVCKAAFRLVAPK